MVSVLHANFISHWVSFVLRCFYKSNSSCLCRGENSELFCLVELWSCTAYALIVWIHWDFNINAVHASQNTKNNFGFTHASSKVHFCSTEAQTLIFYWSISTADDSIKCRCANSSMTGQMKKKSWGLSARVSFLSSPPPPRSLTCAIFCPVFNLL